MNIVSALLPIIPHRPPMKEPRIFYRGRTVGEKSLYHSLSSSNRSEFPDGLMDESVHDECCLQQHPSSEHDCETPSRTSAKTNKEWFAELRSTQSESPVDTHRIVSHEPSDCGESSGEHKQNQMLECFVHSSILHSRLVINRHYTH